MNEKAVPPVVPPRTDGTLGDMPARNAREAPSHIAFRRRAGDAWAPVTAAQFDAEVEALAKGFVASGVTPGQRVGIMARTRYEWTLLDFALWCCGAVPVPIYETSSAEQVQWILEDSGAVGVVVESAAHLATVESVRHATPRVTDVWGIDAGDLANITASGRDVSDGALVATRAGLDRSSPATIIYTSGTTGRPKGVGLTHGNFLDLVENAGEAFRSLVHYPGASTLLFLPLAHVFARFIEVLCVDAGVTMGHSADIKTLVDDFGAFQPTFILAVPRVFEKIYNSADAKATTEGKGKIFATATATAIAYSEALDTGRVPLGVRARHLVFDKLVYGRLRAAMGGKLLYAVSGGAPLGTRLGHFFRGVGVTILEGYGLTETTAPATVNRPETVRIGTVGTPLPGCAVAIAEDGEILIRGVGTFHGYHNNDAATAEAIHDGWFHSGDIGELDADGYLRITGRKKELLVTAGGKNVAPAVLEDRLRAHLLVSQCIVVGDQKPFIAALVTLDEEMIPVWAKANGIEGLTIEGARTNPAVLAEVQKAVDEANAAVSKAESIRKFVILDTDFTEASGHLTPSLKLRRTIIMRDFGDEVEALYGG